MTTPPEPPLVAAAQIGPFFGWEQWSATSGWRPLTDLDDPELVAERVETAATVLRERFALPVEAVPVRVVASVLFLGMAARLLSPLLGAAVVGGALPIPSRRQLWWRPVESGPLPVAYQGLAGMPSTGLPAATVAAVFRTAAVTGLVAPLLAVFRERFRLSPQVLRGNVASALAGAVGMLAQARPAHAERAGQILADVLDQPPLAGAGTLVRPDPGRARRFLVRHNCCLYYRIPGGGTCGDCVLTPSAERERQWRSVLDADPASGSAAGTRP